MDKQENKSNDKYCQFTCNIGDVLLSEYRILKELTKGGMNSTIYIAERLPEYVTKSNRNEQIAIKIINRDENIDDNDWKKFYDEFLTSMRLSSVKNVIKTYEKKILNNSTIIIAMEYIDGVSLRKYIDIKKTLPLNEALYIIKKVIVAIKEMHKFTDKIIHRDLKPENILLSNDLLQVKLIDFGISSVTKKLKNNRIKLQTNEHAIFGTYPYLSPDIIKLSSAEYEEEKKKYISEQLDFFSIGVILYEMLSGKKPFFASDYNKKEVIELPLKFDFIPLSSYNGEIPASVDNIIFRCLASKPYELHYRYTNADEILKDINMIGKSSNVQLIKPLNKCVIPIKNFFNIEKEKNLERNYEKYWFFWTIIALSIILFFLSIFVIFLLL